MNVLILVAFLIGIAVGFCAAFFVFLLGYRSAQLNLKEAEAYGVARMEGQQL